MSNPNFSNWLSEQPTKWTVSREVETKILSFDVEKLLKK